MANVDVLMSFDVRQENGMQDSVHNFNTCSQEYQEAFNMCVIDTGSLFQDINMSNASLNGINRKSQIHVEIVEQPTADGIKGRYKKERRLSSRIIGENSTKRRKTFPTLKINGDQDADYDVVVSLVSVEAPYYPHPHELVGESCINGICYKEIKNSSSEVTISFSDLRLQCVRRKDVKRSLATRAALQVDPFGTGFSLSNEPKKINYNAVRLCFQVLLKNGERRIPLDPVISTPILNKAVCDLTIMKLSHCSAPVSGNEEVILLCGQVKKDDIEIVFYEENEAKETIWFEKGKFSPDDVHCKVAISFKTPAYMNPDIQKPVKCFVFLRQPSDGIVGKPREFTLYPSNRGAVNQFEHTLPQGNEKMTQDGDAEFPGTDSLEKMNCLDLDSNNLCENLSGMTIDSASEISGIIAVGLLDGQKVDV